MKKKSLLVLSLLALTLAGCGEVSFSSADKTSVDSSLTPATSDNSETLSSKESTFVPPTGKEIYEKVREGAKYLSSYRGSFTMKEADRVISYDSNNHFYVEATVNANSEVSNLQEKVYQDEGTYYHYSDVSFADTSDGNEKTPLTKVDSTYADYLMEENVYPTFSTISFDHTYEEMTSYDGRSLAILFTSLSAAGSSGSGMAFDIPENVSFKNPSFECTPLYLEHSYAINLSFTSDISGTDKDKNAFTGSFTFAFSYIADDTKLLSAKQSTSYSMVYEDTTKNKTSSSEDTVSFDYSFDQTTFDKAVPSEIPTNVSYETMYYETKSIFADRKYSSTINALNSSLSQDTLFAAPEEGLKVDGVYLDSGKKNKVTFPVTANSKDRTFYLDIRPESGKAMVVYTVNMELKGLDNLLAPMSYFGISVSHMDSLLTTGMDSSGDSLLEATNLKAFNSSDPNDAYTLPNFSSYAAMVSGTITTTVNGTATTASTIKVEADKSYDVEITLTMDYTKMMSMMQGLM